MAEPTVGIKAVFDGTAAVSGLKNLRQGVEGATKAAKGQSSVVGGLARVQKSVGSLLNVYTAAAAGAVAVGAAAFGMVKDFALAEVSSNRLKASVIAATGSWKAYEGALNDTINAGMNKAFDDEAQMDALSRLVQGTQDVAASQRLLSLAQDVSRGTGKDLTSTAIMLAKVYNGNTGALKRFGIAVKEGMTAEEALGEVQKRYAGQADAYANSTQGRIDKLTVAWDNVREATGQAIANDAVTGSLDNISRELNALSEGGIKAAWQMGYLDRMVEAGKMTREQADAEYKRLYGSVGSLAATTKTATSAITDLTAAQDESTQAGYAMEDASIADERSHLRLKDAAKAAADAKRDEKKATEAVTKATHDHGAKSKQVTSALQQQKEAQRRVKDTALDMRDATLGAKRADDALNNALADSDDPTKRAVANMQRLKKEADRLKKSANQAASALDKMFGKGAGDATRKAAGYGGAGRALGSIERATPGGVPVTVAEAGSDEAIIPLNRSTRSLALLAETNRRMGTTGGGGDTRIFNISGFDTPAAVEHVLNRLAFQPAASL